jgi:multiple sugar transport system substrate-binding protein
MLTMLLVCVLFITACSAGPSSTGATNTGSQQILIAWHSLSGRRERALLKLIDRFNATNRNGIVVVPEHRTRNAHHAAMSGSALPHLALVEPAQAALYAQRGILTQLDGFIANDEDADRWNDTDRADLFPFVLNAGKVARGTVFGLPLGGDMRVVVRNLEWASSAGLTEMPATWAALEKSCASVDQLSGSICFAITSEQSFFEEWAGSHGAPPYFRDTNTLQIASPNSAAAMNQLIGYLQSGIAYRAQSEQRALDDFASGRVSYFSTWSSQLDTLTTRVRASANFATDISTWPADDGRPTALLTAPLWVIPASTPEHERNAWRFIRWLLEEPQTAQWAADTGEVPARVSAVNTLNLDAAQTAQTTDTLRATVLLRVAPNAVPVPVVSGWPCVQAGLATSMRNIFEGQSITETLILAQAQAQNVITTDCTMQ